MSSPSSVSSSKIVSQRRTDESVRSLDASSLGLNVTGDDDSDVVAPTPDEYLDVEDSDQILVEVRALLDDGYAGVIFVGPPGTGKSWYAERISRKLIDFENHPERRRLVQFHHSYQYEDFVEGFVPRDGGGFELVGKHLLEMCEIAKEAAPNLCIIVIDELSRSDPGRVFGEALTYIEMDKRGRKFSLASGNVIAIPQNLVFLATMNPLDRGADQVDAAFERRFAKIGMEPSVQGLEVILEDSSLDEDVRARLVTFYRALLAEPTQAAHVGHAYFIHAKDNDSLRRLWNHQLRFHLERAFQLFPEGFERVRRRWERVLPAVDSEPSATISQLEPSEN